MPKPQPTLALLENAVPHKMKAADYHLKCMRKIFDKGLVTEQAIKQLTGLDQRTAISRSDRFFWHFEAFLSQLYSAFDLMLQELNVRAGLNIHVEEVTWGRIINALSDDPTVIHLKQVRQEDWFVQVRDARHQAMHHHPPVFAAIAKGDKIEAMAYGQVTVGDKVFPGGPELFGLCDKWWTSAREALVTALEIMRKSTAS